MFSRRSEEEEDSLTKLLRRLKSGGISGEFSRHQMTYVR